MSSKSEALVILNGELPEKKLVDFLWNRSKIHICADGAASSLKKWDKNPDIIIGDLDSISLSLLQTDNSSQIIKDQNQETTDGEKALQYCLDHQLNRISMIGAFGYRMDHSLYNIGLLRKFHGLGLNVTCYTDYDKLFLIDQPVTISSKPGTRVSLFPIYEKVCDVTLSGFKYPLKQPTLIPGEYESISNIIMSKNARIEFKSGILLVVLGFSAPH